MECKKCKTVLLSKVMYLENGITAQPCYVCSNQNYVFPQSMQKKDGADCSNKCKDCGEPTGGMYSDFCDECRHTRRSLSTRSIRERQIRLKFVPMKGGYRRV